jgi:hypothetical protein
MILIGTVKIQTIAKNNFVNIIIVTILTLIIGLGLIGREKRYQLGNDGINDGIRLN